MWKLKKRSIKLSYLTSAYMLLHCSVRKKGIICYHLWIMSQDFDSSIYFLYDWMKSCGEDKKDPPLEMPFTSIHLCKYLKATSFVTFALVPQPKSSLPSSLSVSFSQDQPWFFKNNFSLLSTLYYSYSCTSLIFSIDFRPFYVQFFFLSLTLSLSVYE